MAYGGDDRDAGIENGTGDHFFIKSPQVLHRAAAPAHDKDIGQVIAVCIGNGIGNFPGGLLPLHTDRKKQDLGQGKTAAENADHIMNGRSCGTGDHADAPWVGRKGLFMLGIKKTLGIQALLKLLEGDVQVTQAVGDQSGAVKLIATVSRIDADLAGGHYLHAVLRAETEVFGHTCKHDAAQGTLSVLEGEIVVAGGVNLIIGDLTTDQKCV